MALKFTVQENLVPGKTLEEKWERLAEWGYQGLELRGDRGLDFKQRLPELKKALKSDVPMPTICLIADRFIGDFDKARREEALAVMQQLIAVAGEIGSIGVVTPASYGMHSNFLPPFTAQRSAEDDRTVLIDMLGQLGEDAQTHGVQLYFEPLNRYEDHMVNTLAQGASLLRELNHPSVKLLADFYHMNIEEADIANAIVDTGSLLGHVHLADSNRHEPGHGHIDYVPGFSALNAINYTGFAAIECFFEQSPDVALKTSFSALQSAER